MSAAADVSDGADAARVDVGSSFTARSVVGVSDFAGGGADAILSRTGGPG